MKIIVTGGSGRAGRFIIEEKVSHGYDVENADITSGPDQGARFVAVDVTDFGQVVTVTRGAAAIIHMAAIPNPLMAPEHEVFRVNMVSNWNVLEAAEIHDIPKLALASSANAIGAVFSKAPVAPGYFPIDEQHPTRAEDGYAQSKWLGEEITLSIPTLEAIVRVYPGVPLRKPLDEFASVLDTSKAERIMGWVHETQWVRNG